MTGVAATASRYSPSSHSGCTISLLNAVTALSGACSSSRDSGMTSQAITNASTGRISQPIRPARNVT